MDIKKRKDILKRHDLRVTSCRLDVIEFFLCHSKAISQGDLEARFDTYDRVTLYRTLGSFLESGIIHKIPNESGNAAYGLCYDTCTPGVHVHDHIHFKCNACGTIECVDGKAVPQVSLPSGYQINAVNMIIDGVCLACAS